MSTVVDAVLELPLSPDELVTRWLALFDDPVLGDADGKVEIGPWGEILVMSPVGGLHALSAGELAYQLRSKLGGRSFQETGVLTDLGVRAPDVMWADDAWIARHGLDTPYRVAPPLCIEVFSPSDRFPPLREKLGAYLRAGAREAWLVVPRAQPKIEFHGPEGRRDASEFGFTIDELRDLARTPR
jgi:Uma2 family endonuclease